MEALLNRNTGGRFVTRAHWEWDKSWPESEIGRLRAQPKARVLSPSEQTDAQKDLLPPEPFPMNGVDPSLPARSFSYSCPLSVSIPITPQLALRHLILARARHKKDA